MPDALPQGFAVRELTADMPAEGDEWLRRWRDCGSEPFAHPAYVRLFCEEQDRAVLVVVATPGGQAVLPLVLRPVYDPERPGAAWDAVSPYGYGGPYIQGDIDGDVVLAAIYWWVHERGLYSAFLRLALDAPVPSVCRDDCRVKTQAPNVVVGVRTAAEQWRHYEHKVRKNVNKARRNGCTVTRTTADPDLDAFLAIYTGTMQRRGASERYYFDRSFFARLTDELAGSWAIYTVHDSTGAPVSVELVLTSPAWSYSYLGGTVQEAFPLAPNDLLKHQVVDDTRDRGARGYTLGGGATPGDGIFRYKRSFAPDGVVDFRTVELIGDVAAYARLSEGTTRSGFFPAYRIP